MSSVERELTGVEFEEVRGQFRSSAALRRPSVRSRLVVAAEQARLNVGHRGHLSFEDGRVERPLRLRHRSLNTGLPGLALRTTPHARGERLCPTPMHRTQLYKAFHTDRWLKVVHFGKAATQRSRVRASSGLPLPVAATSSDCQCLAGNSYYLIVSFDG